MNKIVFKNVTKRFGKVIAVDHLNLRVKDKEFIVLLGPSGCGKTTILRLLAGLEEMDEGSIHLEGKLINDMTPKDRNIAMVFQDYALYPHMSAFDNMAFGLRNLGTPKHEIERMIKETTKLLQIEHLLERKPKQLSGGQKQRVALGRAIVRKPQAFLLDEPLSNLDAKLRVQMRVELRKLQRELGVTTVYVTHDQIEAMSLSDRIVLIKDGILQQVGPPDELFNHPLNKFVAGFIGAPSMNFIECSLVERHGSFALDGGSFTLPLRPEITDVIKDAASGTELLLGVRPADIYIADGKQENTITAKVETVESLGEDKLAHFNIGNKNIVIARLNPKEKINPGEKVKILFDSKKIHIIDRKTEVALV